MPSGNGTQASNMAIPFGQKIAPLVEYMRQQLASKAGKNKRLSKTEARLLLGQLATVEEQHIKDGVNFSRIQIGEVLADARGGRLVEFETLGPYLASYAQHGGRMARDNLIPEDAIGLALAVAFHKILPQARLVSLCDEYNGVIWSNTAAHDDTTLQAFDPAVKKVFIESLVRLFKEAGAIDDDAAEGRDYFLIPESSKVKNAPQLVANLEAKGCIQRNAQEIIFVNKAAENPLHHRFHLRTKHGRWLCEALDASAFLHPANRDLTHIVVLPDYMKIQQDKVWEILRVLGIEPSRYHNIFYDKTRPAGNIVTTIQKAFHTARRAGD